MNSYVSLAFRLLELVVGLVLIVVGAGLFVILTSAINEPVSMGGPMKKSLTLVSNSNIVPAFNQG